MYPKICKLKCIICCLNIINDIFDKEVVLFFTETFFAEVPTLSVEESTFANTLIRTMIDIILTFQ